MEYYLNKFIEQKFGIIQKDNNNAYLFILWVCHAYINEQVKLSDKIKEKLKDGDLLSDITKIENLLFQLCLKQNSSIKSTILQTHSTLNLKSVQIKNFKGFTEVHCDDKGCHIDIHENRTIIFAPNGGGKTSFCEALEYELTGGIKEAKKRGYKDSLSTYFKKNDRNETKITIKFNKETVQTNTFKDADFRYFETCFIEKNRIQEFALLGINKQEEKNIIAILFGLEDLDQLAGSSSFVLPNSFKLNELKKELAKKAIEKLEKENADNLITKSLKENEVKDKVIEIEKILETTFSEEIYNKKVEELNINVDSLTKQIASFQTKPFVNHIKNDIITSFQQIKGNIDNFSETDKFIKTKKQETDYKALYEAIQKIQESNLLTEKCPACDTPLSNVTKNPFEKAKDELALDNLKEISEKEKVLDNTKEKVKTDFIEITTFLKNCKENIENFSLENEKVPLKLQEFRNILIPDKTDFNNQFKLIDEVCQYIIANPFPFEMDSYFEKIEEIQKSLADKSSIEKKQNELKKIQEQFTTIKLYKTETDKIKGELLIIENNLGGYTENKSKLEKEYLIEEKHNKFVDEVEKCYKIFHQDLQNFKVEEERNKFDGVEIPATKYYQQINKYDSDAEQIEKITFEKGKENYRIKVKLKNEEIEEDAFARLSEGHIRALGLSMMLAIAEKEGKPFLIFDDVVNAIDSDHRANIIEMFHTDSVLKQKQQIITTHDRLFWERFCNFNNTGKDKYHSYVFDYSITHGITHKNYDVSFSDKIQQALNVYDIRQALVYSRIWFETLATDYCLEKGIKITAKFSSRKKEKNNLIKVDLENIYREVSSNVSQNVIIDSVYHQLYGRNNSTWSGMNQENHSLDEANLNFSHSKTSREIQDIFDNIKKLEFLLFPQKLDEEIEKVKGFVETIKTKINTIVCNFLNNTNFETKKPELYEIKKNDKAKLENEIIEKEIYLNELELYKTSIIPMPTQNENI